MLPSRRSWPIWKASPRSTACYSHCRFDTEVRGIVWDEATATWTVRLSGDETLTADVVVSAIGMFNELVRPDLPGLDRFAGTVFHSAEWALGSRSADERVAVVGSAASAVQLVPEIVKQAGQVYLFQRTANWVLPKQDTPYTEEELARFRRRSFRRSMPCATRLYSGSNGT